MYIWECGFDFISDQNQNLNISDVDIRQAKKEKKCATTEPFTLDSTSMLFGFAFFVFEIGRGRMKIEQP